MRWTTLNFGKHSGRSLPEIILCDADWFFWAVANSVFQGRLSREAKELMSRATAIVIPCGRVQTSLPSVRLPIFLAPQPALHLCRSAGCLGALPGFFVEAAAAFVDCKLRLAWPRIWHFRSQTGITPRPAQVL